MSNDDGENDDDDAKSISDSSVSVEDEQDKESIYTDSESGTDSSNPPSEDEDFLFDPSSDCSEDEAHASKAKRKRGKAKPGSDDDPDPLDTDNIVYPMDKHGWSRNLKPIHIHRFKGPTPQGPNMAKPEKNDPLSYFLAFFPPMLFKKIARYTNISGHGNPRFTKQTTSEEIKAWIGIKMVQGVHRNQCFEDDWSTNPALRNSLVSSTMTRGRFNILSEVLACANPKKGPKTIKNPQQRWAYMMTHPMYPLEIVWDTVLANCLANWNPRKELSMDETTLLYKCQHHNVKRFLMPLQPTKTGFKIFTVCESKTGYLLNMLVHPETGINTKSIALKIMEPFLYQFHELYLKRTYTSVALASELLKKRTYLCGEVRKSAKGLPVDFSTDPTVNVQSHKKIQDLEKAPRYTMYFRQHGKMSSVIWKDSKVVSLISTCHQSFRDKTEDNTKDHEKTAKKKTSFHAPPHATAYGRQSAGVRRNEQLRCYQSSSRHSMKWWRKILYFLIDVSRVNAWLCYKANTSTASAKNVQSSTPLNHHYFTINLATALIDGFAEGTPEYQHLAKPVPLLNGPRHQLVRMPSTFGRMCMQCHQEGKRTPSKKAIMTRTGCMSCNIHLCAGRCFLLFHSAGGVNIENCKAPSSMHEEKK